MIIAVDFDGTCVDHRFPEVGDDAPHCVEVLKEFTEDHGHQLILWTMRGGKYLDDAVQWFKERGIELYGIQRNPEQDSWTDSPKAYAQVYIDDAALGCPMAQVEGFKRPCVDWNAVKKSLLNLSSMKEG